MKSKFTCLIICILLFACNNKNTLSFEPLTIATDSCENCTTVTIEIPNAKGNTKLSETINSALEGEIIALLNFEEESNAQNLEDAKKAFVFDYEELNGKFPKESMPWEANIEGTITHENEEIITIEIQSPYLENKKIYLQQALLTILVLCLKPKVFTYPTILDILKTD